GSPGAESGWADPPTVASGPATSGAPGPPRATTMASAPIRIAAPTAARASRWPATPAVPDAASAPLPEPAMAPWPEGASNTRHGGDFCSTDASAGGLRAGQGNARRAARPAARRVSTGDSAGQKFERPVRRGTSSDGTSPEP